MFLRLLCVSMWRGPECSRLMNGQRALDILDCRVIAHPGDILMAAPRKTMGSGGAPLPAFESDAFRPFSKTFDKHGQKGIFLEI